jgi:hypothetical protein
VLTKPDIADETIVTCAAESFGLRISNATFLPIGADVNSAVYRLTTLDGARYLLKLRRGNFDQIAPRASLSPRSGHLPRYGAACDADRGVVGERPRICLGALPFL